MGARFLGALGLRGRIIGAVLIASVATLIVAALALLGPLEASLRNAEKTTLKQEFAGTRGTAVFESRAFDPGKVSYGLAPPSPSARSQGTGGASITPNPGKAVREEDKLYHEGVTVRDHLIKAVQSLQSSTGAAEVALLGYPDVSGQNSHIVVVAPNLDIARQDPRDDVATAFRTQHRVYSFGSIGGTEVVREAIPFSTAGLNPGHPEHWVLVVRKPLDTLSDAVSTVRRAFVYAALAGLAHHVAARDSALSHDRPAPRAGCDKPRSSSLPTVRRSTLPADRRRDEVGDLARAFAQMQQRLQQQEEARRAFVATASHELRTPLASLDGMLELLDDDLGSGNPDLD